MRKRSLPRPKRVTIDDLAAMVARGFEHTATKGDVATLKGDVATLKGDVATLKGDVATLKGDMARLEHKVDDGFAHVNARLDQVRRDIADLDDLRERVQALEEQLAASRGT
ncbi:MAG: hypothetical protein Q8R13_05720 [bacterium]|nr:hypothetical protein [bacterium]